MSITKLVTRRGFALLLIGTSNILNADSSVLSIPGSRVDKHPNYKSPSWGSGCSGRSTANIYNATPYPVYFDVTFSNGEFHEDEKVTSGQSREYCGGGNGINIDYDYDYDEKGRQLKTYQLFFGQHYNFVEVSNGIVEVRKR